MTDNWFVGKPASKKRNAHSHTNITNQNPIEKTFHITYMTATLFMWRKDKTKSSSSWPFFMPKDIYVHLYAAKKNIIYRDHNDLTHNW